MSTPDDGLLSVTPRWVTLSGEYTEGDRGLRAITLLDEAVALGAPFDGFGLQVGVGVTLIDVDPTGQPTPDEKPRLKAFEAGLVQALGTEGRLVAALTVDGVREYVAYVRSTDVLLPWRDAPPAGMDVHDWQVQVLEDPSWLGLREIAGLLQPGEEMLAPLPELPAPDVDDIPLPPHEQGAR
ncbi:MAG: hypothetical protein JWM64_1988 [Frankiales bacterium]|nr:hypothetical protein [Frankiales bacterium]